jgi:hypothetical protein
MFNSEYNKTWIALIMALVTMADLYFGTALSVTEEWITTLSFRSVEGVHIAAGHRLRRSPPWHPSAAW